MVAKKKPDQDVVQEKTAREIAREELLAAGFLVTEFTYEFPEDFVPLTPEEILEIGQLPAGARPSEELIAEDRDRV
ncbi:MAG: hypothetical protein H7175_15710 [Burkholderiales bacterium]|nr:hypothetical protein [Anaerolineae bacterium]